MNNRDPLLSAARFYVPFFSENVLASIRIGLGISCLILLCLWPGNFFLDFRFSSKAPLIYPAFFIFSLIFCAHHLMAFAKGEYQQITDNAFDAMAGRYARSILWVLIRHAVIVHAMLVPFYLVVATVSGISLTILGQSFLILVLSSVLCALFGVCSLIISGPLVLYGFFISRAFFVAFFTLTGWISPVLNPVYLLYSFFKHGEYQTRPMGELFIPHVVFVGLLILSFMAIGKILVLRKGRTTA